MLGTWQLFLQEKTIEEIEVVTGIKRKITDRVRTFWREFKPYQPEKSKNDLQDLLDSDNKNFSAKVESSTKRKALDTNEELPFQLKTSSYSYCLQSIPTTP